MLTVSQQLRIADISQPMSLADIKRIGGAYSNGIDLTLPAKIYTFRKSVSYRWEGEGGTSDTIPSEGLVNTANKMISLCGIWAVRAKAVISSGGSIAPIVPPVSNLYPFFIYSSDFESDGVTYNNMNIVGDDITLFINEWTQRWLTEEAGDFVYTSTGIIMTAAGFNANDQNYTILVQQVFSGNPVSIYPFIFDATFSQEFN